MRHLGDIKNIDGAKIPPVDIITGGSPCQDLSVAGRRLMLENHIAGLKISKSTGYWNDDDERTLDLMERIKAILDRVQEGKGE